MKKIFTILLAVISINIAIAQAPDATYRLIRQNYTFNADGSLDYNFRKEITLHANRAMTAYATNGETFIVYNPQYETLTINECYTIQPDGTKVVAPQNAFINQLPEGVVNSARYNNLREMAIVHTGLQLEATIVLDYTIHRTNNTLMQKIVLTEPYPINQYEINIKATPEYQYMVQPQNMNLTKYTTSGDKGEFHLTAYNLPQKFIDSYLPSEDILYPAVYVSNLQQNQLFQMLSMNDTSSYIDYTPQLNNIPIDINQFKKDKPLATIKAIREWVNQYISTITIPQNTNVNRLNTADITWKENCGTPESKIILMTSMLQKAGIPTAIQWGISPLLEYEKTQYTLFDNSETRLIVMLDNLEYKFNPLTNQPLELCNAAQEEMTVINTTKELPWNPTPITEEYAQITIPHEPNALAINLARIPMFRTTPIQCHATNETYHYTIKLPKGAKLLKKINKEFENDTIGSVKIKIYQKGNTLHIERNLINQNDLITPKNMITFYNIIYLWETTRKIIIKL